MSAPLTQGGARSVAFTGHRPEAFPFFEGDADFKRLDTALSKCIERLYALGARDFYCGMARGCDLWAAEALLRLELPLSRLICCLPFEGHADRWGGVWKGRHDAVLSQAAKALVVSPCPGKDAFFARNRFMVDEADALLAVFSGKRRSGTWSTIAYARRQRKPVLYIDANTMEVALDMDEQLSL